MTPLKRFAAQHKLMLQAIVILLALVLLGLATGALIFAVMEACGLAEWAALIWLLATA
ncbi:hypothetical protein OZX57_06565 [Bifidobacterium sp. ESL0682]|uniref:hypothetical protein n=1 Tax=Bifidobacterium sp. ESL0682 TaxID=2983212 RepID=UPI0023F723B1|nr:hypothetical protein [Bifidobacterium sp. ESL0682]WEV41649.1 hypothetical protein OZX57_06565 [Bifidobacterium sp. ESL0682]